MVLAGDRPAEHDAIGDHVVRAAAVEPRHADHAAREWIDVAGDDGLQPGHECVAQPHLSPFRVWMALLASSAC